MARRAQRFTIYDVMERDGAFDSNPANNFATDADGTSIYKGPIEFPKMLYHPFGEEMVVVPAEIIMTPIGPKAVGEQRELKYKVVHNEVEEEKLLAEGWHTSPGKAIAVRTGVAPPQGKDDKIADLEATIRKLQLERNSTAEGMLAATATPPVVPLTAAKPARA